MSPAEQFDLKLVARVTVNSANWVVYSDGPYTWAIDAEDWDTETDDDDYSLWAASTIAAGNTGLCRRIAKVANLEGIHAAGTADWVSVED